MENFNFFDLDVYHDAVGEPLLPQETLESSTQQMPEATPDLEELQEFAPQQSIVEPSTSRSVISDIRPFLVPQASETFLREPSENTMPAPKTPPTPRRSDRIKKRVQFRQQTSSIKIPKNARLIKKTTKRANRKTPKKSKTPMKHNTPMRSKIIRKSKPATPKRANITKALKSDQKPDVINLTIVLNNSSKKIPKRQSI